MSGLLVEAVLRRGRFTLDVSLRVEPGEVVALLGPNGAGKSTLLDIAAGLVRPDRGRVVVGGRTVTTVAPHGRQVGLLAQDPLLFPHLSVLANVAFGPRSSGVPRREAQAAARHWLSEVDGLGFAARRPKALSGGQAARVALARALAARPSVLLLDEPFAALDVDVAPMLRALVRRVLGNGEQRAAVLVTHDPLDALVLADRVVVLADGEVVEDGPTRDVLARPRTPFTARIAGLDLVAGTACEGGLRTGDGGTVAGVHAEQIGDGEPAVAVFHPSAVAVYAARGEGSPRNVVPAEVAVMEPHGDVIRLRMRASGGGPAWADGLAADLTPAAVADLRLEPGSPVYLAVKAAEVIIHQTTARPPIV